MDTSPEVRPSLNPTKKTLISGSEESRKEKKVRRRLSSVPEEMGSQGAAEDGPRKFKFPKKILGDSNTVDPASVPRKLRSAIRKRGCVSGSVALPNSKRPNSLLNGVEPPRMECLKKSKMNTNVCLDHSLKQAASAPISKDEEEVAATLFALAGMIPLSDLSMKRRTCDEDLEAKASNFTEKHGKNSMPVSRVSKQEQEATCLPSSEVAITTPMADSLANDSVQEKSLTGPAPLTCAQLSERRSMNLNLKVSVPPVNLQSIPPLLQTCDPRSSLNSSLLHTSTRPSTGSGLNEIKQEKTFNLDSESLARTGEADVESQDARLVERGLNGEPSRALLDSGVYGVNMKSSAINFPSWLSTDTHSSRLGRRDLSTNKPSSSTNDRRNLWKRCAAHVYISHLIRVMQISEEKESWDLETSHLEQFCTLNGSLIKSNLFNSAKYKETTGLLAITNMFSSFDCKNFHDRANFISVNHKCHHVSFSGYGSKKQSFELHSLSEAKSHPSCRVQNHLPSNPYSESNLQSEAKSHVLHQHIVAQDNRHKPFLLLKNHLPPYSDQVAPVSLGPLPTPPPQVPQYFGNPFVPSNLFNATTSAQPQSEHQHHQQLQQILSTQLAVHFRPDPMLSPHFTNWQKGRKDLLSSIYTENLNPSFQPSKYLHISQHQP